MRTIQAHPGYAIAFKMKQEQVDKQVSDWITENIIKTGYPDLLGKDMRVELHQDGGLYIVLPNEAEPAVPQSQPQPQTIAQQESIESDPDPAAAS